MNKSTRKAIMSTVPSLGARTTSYKGYFITQYRETEGPRYVVTTLTGHSVKVTRSLVDARQYVDKLNRSNHPSLNRTR